MAPLVPMEDERELRESLTRRMCCIGDHERVQKKTFTRWLNKHERISIEDLYDDLKDGKVLIALLELLSGDVIVHDQSPHSQNVQSMEAVLSFLKQQQARIVNIRSFDITVGNPKLTLSLIWTVILHYQVSVPGEQVELLTWAQQVVGNQPGLPCHDLSSCWQDGRLFNTILHRIRPGLVDLEAVHHQSNKQNLQQAFAMAERHLGIPQLLDPEDVDVNSPDERSIATYLAVLRQAAEGHLPQDGKKLGEGPEDVQSLKKQPPLSSVQDSQRYTHGGVTKEDQACLTFITELQAWVDMNQKEVNATNFGEDLKEVATLVEEQNASHDAIEELRKSLEEAQQCKESLSASCRADYDKHLDVLQRSYNVLVSSSNKRRRQLQELLTFLRAATDKLTWLGSCEDRQVSLDWSDNCPQLDDRQEDYVLLMQEMARQDPAFHGILEQGEELLQEGHPACRHLQGYIDALQTQWSWLLQLDSCTETHLQKNAEYFQFFRDSQSLHQELTSLHDSLVQECSCDCDSEVVRLSKALDSIQEKSERLSELHAGVAKLSKKADMVVQLKPRRADYVLESSIPICAICDYKQSKVTLVKNYMYKLEGLHENGKWSIQDSDGRHALVPSVCFIVPPPNVEAGERARRLEEQQLEVEHLLKQQKFDMEAILSWHHLQDTIKSINSWTPCSFQDLSDEVSNSVLDRLENQSIDFKEKIKGSRVFPPEKLRQLEKDASSCKHHYQALLNNLVSEENEEQTYRQLLTELQATGDRLMSLRDEVVQVVREQSADSSLDNMPSMLTRQERLDQEVDTLGTRLDQISQQCEPLLNHASRAPSQADLRAELDRCLQIRPHLSDLSTSSLDRLRSLKQVRSIMTGLEQHIVKFETSLAEQSSVPTNAQAIEQYQQSVKGMRADLSRHSGTLQSLQDEVSRAHSATEGLSRLEPCAGNLEPVAEAARLLHKRWRDVGSQMDSRLCELDHLSLLLAEYRESYDCVIQWLLGVSAQQDLSQIRQGKSSRELQSHLIQQKTLIAKVERTQEEVTRCHELSEKYCNAVKEYEAKLAAYRDLVESITGAVLDHRPTSSALNNIEKEVISLLDRYASLLNLTKDNAKLLGEALQQAQENEEEKQRQRETEPSQEALLKGTHSNGPETGNMEMNSKAKLENVIKMENFESQNHVYQLSKECVAMLRWEAEKELHQRSQEAAIVQLELDKSKREATVLHDQVLMTCIRYEKAETELETIQAKTREHTEYNTDMERKRAKFQEEIKEALDQQRESDLHVHRCHIELEDVQTHISEGKNQGLDQKRAEANAYAKTQKAMQALGDDRKWVAKLKAQELKMFREAEAMIQARECGVANVNALLAQLCQLSHERGSAEHRLTQLHVRTSALAQDLKEAEARVAICARRLAKLQLCVLDGRRGVDPANIDREERLRLWGEVMVNRKEAEEKEVHLQALLDTTSRRDIPVSEVEQHHRSRLTHPDASEKQSDIITTEAPGTHPCEEIDEVKSVELPSEKNYLEKDNLKVHENMLKEEKDRLQKIYEDEIVRIKSDLKASVNSELGGKPQKEPEHMLVKEKDPANMYKEAEPGFLQKLEKQEVNTLSSCDPSDQMHNLKTKPVMNNHNDDSVFIESPDLASPSTKDELSTPKPPHLPGFEENKNTSNDWKKHSIRNNFAVIGGDLELKKMMPKLRSPLVGEKVISAMTSSEPGKPVPVPSFSENIDHKAKDVGLKNFPSDKMYSLVNNVDVIEKSSKTIKIPEIDSPAQGPLTPHGFDEDPRFKSVMFSAPFREVGLDELIELGLVDVNTAKEVVEGHRSVEDVSKAIHTRMWGVGPIAGILHQATEEKLPIFQAKIRGVIGPSVAYDLLEAQLATGFIIDPQNGSRLRLTQAVQEHILDEEMQEKLSKLEMIVRSSFATLPEAARRGEMSNNDALRLTSLQRDTGGIVHPRLGLRIPIQIAVVRGLLQKDMAEKLSGSDSTSGFYLDPSTNIRFSYKQLLDKCVSDRATGLLFLPVQARIHERRPSQTSSIRRSRVLIIDPTDNSELTPYQAYCKEIIDLELYAQLSGKESEWEEVVTTDENGVVKTELFDRETGVRFNVDAALAKGLIDKQKLDHFRSGKISPTEFVALLSKTSSKPCRLSPGLIPQSPNHNRHSSNSAGGELHSINKTTVAGIMDLQSLEKITISESMKRNLVDAITGQRLLEAQACTGGIISPFTGQRFSLQDAQFQGLIETSVAERITLAQRAYTGYENPKTGVWMSTAEAMCSGRLPYETGQRFLQAQVLTGGLVEPNTPGRVSLDEAERKGSIDARTARKLRDTSTCAQCLTCPKTKLKISLKEAIESSMIDPVTGLSFLEASATSTRGLPSPYSVHDGHSRSTSGRRTHSFSSSSDRQSPSPVRRQPLSPSPRRHRSSSSPRFF